MDGRALYRLRTRLDLTQAEVAEVFYCDHTQVWEHEHEPNFGEASKRRPSVRFRGDVATALERALTRHTPATVWPRQSLARVDRVALILALGAEDPSKLRELLQVELLPSPPRKPLP